MPHFGVGRVEFGNARSHFRDDYTRPGHRSVTSLCCQAATALLTLGLIASCATPTPLPATPQAPPTPDGAAAQPTLLAPSAISTVAASGSSVTPSSTSAAPDGLTAAQRTAYASAHQALVEGDFLHAAEQWQAQLSVPGAANEARYELALALASDGRGADAVQVLETSAAGGDTREPFVRGLAQDAANQHTAAMQSLADFAAATPQIASAVWLEVAERELTARRNKEAADASARGLDTAQTRPLKQRLLEVRAQALAGLGDTENAFDAHRQVLALATSRTTLGEQLFRLAQASRDLGKRDAAIQALKTALDQFPSATTTPDALRLLDELGAANEIDPFVLGRARYFAVDYRNAVTAFERYLSVDPNGPDVPAARLYRALASLTPGNEPNALRELDAIANDPDQETEIAAQALVEAGQALEGLGLPDQAEGRYQKLLDTFPRLDAAATAAFRLGLVRFARGADNEAIGAWDTLLARRDNLSPDDVSRALYWRASALARQQRDTDAAAAYTEAAALRPATYYSLRAALALGQLGQGATDTQITTADEQQLSDWLAGRNQDLLAADATVALDPALTRAQAEASLGLFRQGNWEADELLQ
ncbi:MAG TPA: tetratricopeptide repeat protein, partial [Chloroflexota bacterium]|nr:tetratricopeptide repeat protein [Chloroflexota bacterium]